MVCIFVKKTMNKTINFAIENLRMWRSGNWVKYESKTSNLLLRLQCDQLLITAADKVLESLSVTMKLKGILKDDVIILIISVVGQEVRKIKFQIRENLSSCLQELSSRFSVVTYGSVVSKKITTKYRKLEDVLKSALEGKVPLNSSFTTALEYKQFVKFCLIDPVFPQVLLETEKIIQNI